MPSLSMFKKVRTHPGDSMGKKVIALQRKWRARKKGPALSARRGGGSQYRSNIAIHKILPSFDRKSPFPLRKYVSLNYSSRDLLTVGASGIMGAIKEFSLNSLFDPDTSGAGHQPYGFDQMATLYSRYKVMGVTVEVCLNAPSASNLAVGCFITDPSQTAETLAGKTVETVNEKQQGVIWPLSDTGSQRVIVRQYVPLHKIFGWTRSMYNNDVDQTTAVISGSPASAVNIQFAAADMALGSSGNVTMITNLKYHCQFYERILLSTS